MVEFFISTHKFQVTPSTWTMIQPSLNRINETGHTEFGFTDINNIYWDIRISSAAIIIANYGEAPDYMQNQ